LSDHSSLIHASCVIWRDHGILLRGASGAGKSDLALRLIEAGATLVADDQVHLEIVGDAVLARPPQVLQGLLEIRGLGLLNFPFQAPAEVTLVIDLVAPERVERLPAPNQVTLLGHPLPLFHLSAWPASTVHKVGLAMQLAAGTIMPAS
jgi:serine kinase of HPr protein (carbohydrate metabolism regulator)